MTDQKTLSTLDYAAVEPPPRRGLGTIAIATGWVVLCAPLGVVCAGLAFMISGLGHGWAAPGSVAWLAPFTFPITGVALALRRQWTGKALAMLLLVAALWSDIYLLVRIAADGWDYASWVWSRDPLTLFTWAASWMLWQVGALAALLWPRRLKRPVATPAGRHLDRPAPRPARHV